MVVELEAASLNWKMDAGNVAGRMPVRAEVELIGG